MEKTNSPMQIKTPQQYLHRFKNKLVHTSSHETVRPPRVSLLSQSCPRGETLIKNSVGNKSSIWVLSNRSNQDSTTPNSSKYPTPNSSHLIRKRSLLNPSPYTKMGNSSSGSSSSAPKSSLACLPANSSVTVTPICVPIASTSNSSSMRKLFSTENSSTSCYVDSFDNDIVPVYSFKKRLPLSEVAQKSTLLSGVSSSKLDKAYGSSASPSEKENVPVDIIEEKPIPPHLLG